MAVALDRMNITWYARFEYMANRKKRYMSVIKFIRHSYTMRLQKGSTSDIALPFDTANTC